MNIELMVGVISSLAAVGAVILAYRANAISAKALKISQCQEDNHDAEIVPYLIDSIAERRDDFEVVAFAMSYTNSADASNSLTRVDLELHYVSAEGTVNHLIFPLADQINTGMELGKLQPLLAPIALGARGTASGWLLFKIPLATKYGPTERYRIVALAASGKRVIKDCFLMKSIFNENGKVSR